MTTGLKPRSFPTVARYELKMLLADRSLALVCALLAIMIGYAFYNGLAETRTRDQMVATVQKSEAARAVSNLERLRRIDSGEATPGPFDNPANPATLGNGSGRQATIPTLALSPLAIGQSDMMPNYYPISTRSKVEFMYDSEVESPWTLLSGHFDLAFVTVFVLPLLIFALTYNLLSSERENGTQRMLMSQPLSLGTVVAGKLAVRALGLLAVAIILPVVLLLLFRQEARGAPGALIAWAGLVAAYGAFWFGLAFAVNSLRLSSAANALVLIAAWTVLVLVVPVGLNLAANLLAPAPSRTELSIQTRAIEADNLRRYDDLFSGDYRYIAEPESLAAKDGRIDVPARTRASFLARRDMDARIDKLLNQFDVQTAAQQAIVDRAGFISPAVVMNEALTALAGNDSRRFLDFRNQVAVFHDKWRKLFEPKILGGVAMTEDDVENLPAWKWSELGRAERLISFAWRLAALLAITGLAGFIGAMKLRRYVVA